MRQDTTILQSEPYSTIYNSLSSGSNNGVNMPTLCARTGLNEREIRKAVETMRLDGTVILSGSTGYYLPDSTAELRAFIRQEEARAKANRRKLSGAKRLYNEWTRDGDNHG